MDTAAPWTFESVATRIYEAATKAARREGLTVGQWLERRVAEWEGEGSRPAEPSDVAEAAGSEAAPVTLEHSGALADRQAELLRLAGPEREGDIKDLPDKLPATIETDSAKDEWRDDRRQPTGPAFVMRPW